MFTIGQTRRLSFLKLTPLAYLEDISDQPGLRVGLFVYRPSNMITQHQQRRGQSLLASRAVYLVGGLSSLPSHRWASEFTGSAST
jgi:hypothetical protein